MGGPPGRAGLLARSPPASGARRRVRGGTRRPLRGASAAGCAPPPARRAREGRVGAVQPAGGRPRRGARGGDRPGAPGGVAPGRADRGAGDDRARPPGAGASWRPRRPSRASSPCPAGGSRRRRTTWAARSWCWSAREHAARRRALPGADEHLRRPRQHRDPAGAVRVARAGLRARLGLDRRRAGPRCARPLLHRRRSGPRPGGGVQGHGLGEARRAARAPPTAARWCWRCAAATSCWATPTSWATRSSPAWGWSTWRPCARRARG